MKRGGVFRKNGTLSWNEGGFRVEGRRIASSGARIGLVVLGLFLLSIIGVLIMIALTESAFLTDESIPVWWSQVTSFGVVPDKGLLSVDFGEDHNIAPITFKGEMAMQFAGVLRGLMPEREVTVKGTGDIPTWVAIVVIAGIPIAIGLMVAIFSN